MMGISMRKNIGNKTQQRSEVRIIDQTSSFESEEISDEDEQSQSESKLNRDIDRDRQLLNQINLGISKKKQSSSISELVAKIEETQRSQN